MVAIHAFDDAMYVLNTSDSPETLLLGFPSLPFVKRRRDGMCVGKLEGNRQTRGGCTSRDPTCAAQQKIETLGYVRTSILRPGHDKRHEHLH